jgi:predicted nucleotidyltransferase
LEHVAGRGQLNLITRLGPLDVLLRLHDARGYDELLAHSDEIDASGLRVRVIDLATLIEIKRSTGRVRDALVVPLLLALQARTTKVS